MTSPDPKAIERWEKQRAKGKTRYILMTGVLGWGAAMFVVMTFFVSHPDELAWWRIALSAIVCLAGGALFGFLTWALSERRYQKHLSERR